MNRDIHESLNFCMMIHYSDVRKARRTKNLNFKGGTKEGEDKMRCGLIFFPEASVCNNAKYNLPPAVTTVQIPWIYTLYDGQCEQS